MKYITLMKFIVHHHGKIHALIKLCSLVKIKFFGEILKHRFITLSNLISLPEISETLVFGPDFSGPIVSFEAHFSLGLEN